MLTWILSHGQLLNGLINTAMLFVWLAYLQLFWRQYRRSTMPKIIINQAAGTGLGSACFISNMSSEAVYIEAVVCSVRTPQKVWVHDITASMFLQTQPPVADMRQRTHQGPLGPNEYFALASFSDMLQEVSEFSSARGCAGSGFADGFVLDVMVVADHASEDLPVGARREFTATLEKTGWTVKARAPVTEQLRSRRTRRELRSLLAGLVSPHEDAGNQSLRSQLDSIAHRRPR